MPPAPPAGFAGAPPPPAPGPGPGAAAAAVPPPVPQLVPAQRSIHQQMADYHNYWFVPPGPNGEEGPRLPPVFTYFPPPQPQSYFNTLCRQSEYLLARERTQCLDALMRPVRMSTALRTRIPQRFFVRQAAGTQVMLQPRLVRSLLSSHYGRMDKICRANRRLNEGVEAARRRQERVLVELLPLVSRLTDDGELVAVVDGMTSPVIRKFMPMCERSQCYLCMDVGRRDDDNPYDRHP
ncbi:uncharacterized protein H6S33_001749 [Morchella sextelata]|uniref:uncharacterized protein n=1 Tax=Morchella sextelata TaxID=1174677 RepID=UPI001D03C807|nr:uncharacterized protein H6S33_001749 [Morchella sextelata]KAH0608615.1 hypothetical protein H6S33_001749 [Morchella sextelata]